MSSGYQENLLDIDLSSKKSEIKSLPDEYTERFIGGRGVAARILWDLFAEEPRPSNVSSPLIFSTGTLSGTNAPMSGRSNITFVSPATGLYCKSNVGGHFGVSLKLSGIDYILVRGKSTSPVYVFIKNGEVDLLDAREIWGKEVRATNEFLKQKWGQETNVACIGPAGENQVAFAAVMSSVYNAAARGGPGAVMGRKNLKAIAITDPADRIQVNDPKEFASTVEETRKALLDDTMADSYYDFGTAASIGPMNDMGTLPSLNFQKGSLDEVEELTSQYWNREGLLKGRIGCSSCVYSCHRFIRIEDGPHKGTYSAGPEYETVSALGSGPGINSIGTLHKSNEQCNDLGLDTISTGGVIQWLMETAEKGKLPEKWANSRYSFGNERAVVELPRLIALRNDVGDLLADGTRQAAKEIGGDTWKWAVQTRGLEQSRVETRGAMGYALAFAMNPRGPDHLHTECLAEFGMTPEAEKIIEDITGDVKYATPEITEKRAEIVRWHEDIYSVSDSLGLCAFTTTAAYGATPGRCASLYRTLTGTPMNGEQIMKAGRRTLTLERLINLELGWEEDPEEYAPWRLMNEEQEDLNNPDPVLDREKMTEMVKDYYQLHGWNTDTGVPREETLEELGLDDLWRNR